MIGQHVDIGDRVWGDNAGAYAKEICVLQTGVDNVGAVCYVLENVITVFIRLLVGYDLIGNIIEQINIGTWLQDPGDDTRLHDAGNVV